MGLDEQTIEGALRFSLGIFNSEAEVRERYSTDLCGRLGTINPPLFSRINSSQLLVFSTKKPYNALAIKRLF